MQRRLVYSRHRFNSSGHQHVALPVTLPTFLPLIISLALQASATARFATRAPATPPADSQRVLRSARDAQAEFERVRRANLPLDTRGSSGRCDVHVGRFCYWWDDGEFPAPPEMPRTKAARTLLLGRLARAAAALPGDRWIAGQRVRYLVEDDRTTDAVIAATECRTDTAWCAALSGFAFHAAGDFAHADSAFSMALSAMPERERCRWTDIRLLLDGDARKRYERMSCADRAPFEARFWGMARPLYMLPANDLRTEHFARLTMAELIRTSRYPHQMPWGDDSQELLVRYGWETGWARTTPSLSSPSDVHVVGQEPTPSLDFVPATSALATPDSADASDWTLHDPLAQSRYAPRYARSVADLDHQIAFFRRDSDSALVVAAFDATAATGFERDTIAAALAVALPSSPDSARVTTVPATRRRGVLTTVSAWGPQIVSVEARDSLARRVARARGVARPPSSGGRVTISDLLLFDGPSNLPTTLDEAAARARGSLRVDRTTPVGVYWEMYGVSPAGEPLAYRLTVTRERASWYRRAAEKLGVVERRAPVRMQWDEPSVRPGAARSRALAVDFSTLPEGRYRIELTLEASSLTVASASRVVDVR
jgi:hypothetical protein